MKSKSLLFLLPVLLPLAATSGHGQTLYWNPSPLTNTWDALSTHWANSSGGTPTLAWNPGDTAIFDQAGTYTVTLSGAQSAAAFGFANGSVTLDLGGTSQSLGNITISAPSANTTAALTNGSLTLNGASDLVITPGVTTGGRIALLDATGLSSLTIAKSTNNITIGGHPNGANPGNYGTFRLSATNNSITAANINIGTTSGANAAGVLNRGELYLGTANTIYANTWTLGNTRDSGLVQFQNDLTNPSVTLRATDGISRVSKITIGQNAAGSTGVGTSHFNLSSGSVDAMINELVISRGGSVSTNPAVNGSFSMGGGTLDATTIWLSKNESGGLNTNTSSFNQAAGTVKVSSLVFGETTTTTGTPSFNSQYTLTSGELRAGEIKAGNGTFNTNSTRRINFNGGTITHYDAATDLLINGKSGTGGSIALVLGTAGSPTIQADTDRTVTLGEFTAVSGSGSLTKTGAGTLAINSAATYSGATTINGGTVLLGGANRLPTGTNLTLANTAGALLNLNNNAQTLGSLSGGGSNGGNVSLGSGALTVGNSTATTFSGEISGTGGSLIKQGTGVLTLASANTHTGGVVISGSQGALNPLRVTHSNALGTGTLTIGSGGNNDQSRLELAGGVTVGNSVPALTSRNNLFPSILNVSGNNTISANLSSGGGGERLTLQSDSGKLTLSGSFSAGRQLLLTGAGDGEIQGNTSIAASYALNKTGTGTWTLNNGNLNNTTATVSNGTLLVNGTLTNSSATVNGGTLGGNGSFSGATTINTTGVLSPGASVGTFGTGELTLNTGSTFEYEMDTVAATADLLNVNGNLTLDGLVTLGLTDLATSTPLAIGTKFSLISYAGTWNDTTFVGYANNSEFTLFSNEWRIRYDDTPTGSLNGGLYANAVTLTVIPEPSAALLGAFGLLALLRRRR